MNVVLTHWRTTLICPALALTLISAGCGGSSSSGTQTPPPPPSLTSGGATSVYVVEQPASGNGSILQFSATANGTAVPTSTLTLPSGIIVTSIATDALGQIYVGGATNSYPTIDEVLVYAAGSTGAATPTRTITGGLDVFNAPQSMVVDSSGQLYVLTGNTEGGVRVYAANANGAATPVRTILGPLTLFYNEFGEALALDRAGTIYVATLGIDPAAGQVYAFAPGLSGNVAPTRTIAVISNGSGNLFAMDTDTTGNLYVVGLAPSLPLISTIYEFSSTASGTATPIRTIAGANASLAAVRDLRIDAAGNIYIAGETIARVPYIAAFASTASGNIAPSISFTSPTFADTSIGSTSVALK